jgi:hypothetical protein
VTRDANQKQIASLRFSDKSSPYSSSAVLL